MLPDEYGLPRVGATGRTLGARLGYSEDDIGPEDRIGPGDRIDADIPVDEDGMVQPHTGGMSVALPPVENLRPHRRPPKHGGTDKRLEVYELETGELSAELPSRSVLGNPVSGVRGSPKLQR
jgi:hypothetical protein